MQSLARRELNRSEYGRLRAYTWLYAFGVTAVALALFFTLCFVGVQVTDDGMAPSLHENDVVLVSRLSKYVALPRRGDLIVFRGPSGEGTLMGRIIALPGERACVVDGRIYIDDMLLAEGDHTIGVPGDMEEVTVGEGSYLVLPDHRALAAMDPKDVIVPVGRIIGRVAARVSPLDSIALFTRG